MSADQGRLRPDDGPTSPQQQQQQQHGGGGGGKINSVSSSDSWVDLGASDVSRSGAAPVASTATAPPPPPPHLRVPPIRLGSAAAAARALLGDDDDDDDDDEGGANIDGGGGGNDEAHGRQERHAAAQGHPSAADATATPAKSDRATVSRNDSGFSEDFFTSDGFAHFTARTHVESAATSPNAKSALSSGGSGGGGAGGGGRNDADNRSSDSNGTREGVDGASTSPAAVAVEKAAPALLTATATLPITATSAAAAAVLPRGDTFGQLDFDELAHFSPRPHEEPPASARGPHAPAGRGAPAPDDADDDADDDGDDDGDAHAALERLRAIIQWRDVAASGKTFVCAVAVAATLRLLRSATFPHSSAIGFAACCFAAVTAVIPIITNPRLCCLPRGFFRDTAETQQQVPAVAAVGRGGSADGLKARCRAFVAPCRRLLLGAVRAPPSPQQLQRMREVVAFFVDPVIDSVVAPVLFSLASVVAAPTAAASPARRPPPRGLRSLGWLLGFLAVIELLIHPLLWWLATPFDVLHCAFLAVAIFHPLRVALFPPVYLTSYNFATVGLIPGNTVGSFSSPLGPPLQSLPTIGRRSSSAFAAPAEGEETYGVMGGRDDRSTTPDSTTSSEANAALTLAIRQLTANDHGAATASGVATNAIGPQQQQQQQQQASQRRRGRNPSDAVADPWDTVAVHAHQVRRTAQWLARQLLKLLATAHEWLGEGASDGSPEQREGIEETPSGRSSRGAANSPSPLPPVSPRLRKQQLHRREVRMVAYDTPDPHARWARAATLIAASIAFSAALYFMFFSRPWAVLFLAATVVASERSGLLPHDEVDQIGGPGNINSCIDA